MTTTDASAPPGFDRPEDVVRRFLWHGATGCKFAASFAKPKDGPILWVEQGVPRVPDDHLSESIDFAFATAAARGNAAAVIFPFAHDENDLLELSSVLARQPSWSIKELVGGARPRGVEADVGVFSLLWKTQRGELASAMVLGPFGWLPVHRRAPYLTVMSWTGGRDNTQLNTKLANDLSRPVGFVDMRIPPTMHAAYDNLWTQSIDQAKKMRAHEDVSINKAARPEVGFSLSPHASVDLRRFLASMP